MWTFPRFWRGFWRKQVKIMDERTKRRETRKYCFTVEGQTEKWYLQWLENQIRTAPDAKYIASIHTKVESDPQKYAKRVNPVTTPKVTHLCDYECDDGFHIQRFQNVLKKLKNANSTQGRKLKYSLGYSNYTFELWVILHKRDCRAVQTDRKKYLSFINQIFCEQFAGLSEYKEENNFKRCLSKLNIEDVKLAIHRSQEIMQNNRDTKTPVEYMGFTYYRDNPSLSIWESVKDILIDCGLLDGDPTPVRP